MHPARSIGAPSRLTNLLLPAGYYYDLDDSYDESDEEEVRAHLRCVAQQPPLKLDTSSEVAGVASPPSGGGLGSWHPPRCPPRASPPLLGRRQGPRGPQEGPLGRWKHATASGFKRICFLSQSRS